jgi:hypothetical protein
MAYVDERSAASTATPEQAWAHVARLGGDERLYVPRELWRARGRAERRTGGPGHRIAGTPRLLQRGDPVDFWEVEEVRAPEALRLRALSRLPGTAWLEVRVQPAPSGGSRLTLRTEFEPDGLAGHLFWWSELAAHRMVFTLMARRLARLVAEPPSGPSPA